MHSHNLSEQHNMKVLSEYATVSVEGTVRKWNGIAWLEQNWYDITSDIPFSNIEFSNSLTLLLGMLLLQWIRRFDVCSLHVVVFKNMSNDTPFYHSQPLQLFQIHMLNIYKKHNKTNIP